MTETIYVYSYIPKLAEQLTSKLPGIKFKDIPLLDRDVFFLDKKVRDEELNAMSDAKILISDAHLLRQFYHRLPNIEWIQLTYAGVDFLIKASKINGIPKYPMTRCSSFEHQLVEYAVAWIINHQRNYTKIPELQHSKDWHGFRAVFPVHIPTVRDLTIAILGLGQIGQQLAKTLKFFGATVIGYGRSATPREGSDIDAYWHGDDLDKVLERADYIVGLLPATPKTKYLLGGNALQAAKKRPVLMNIGRGELIPEADILKALDNKWISGAILDVFEFEPLRTDSPLWDHPDVIVTPHIAAKPTGGDIAKAFQDNYERFRNKKPFNNLVNFEEGY